MPINAFLFRYQWRAVLSQKDVGYAFPSSISRFLKENYTVPSVYRWRIHGPQLAGSEPIYVGETENVAQRLQRVLTPASKGGETNRRLRAIFQKAVDEGSRVFLDVIDFDPFELNGLIIQQADLGDGFIRRAIENLVLCIERNEKHPILNKFVDPVEKVAGQLARLGLTPRQVSDILQAVKQGKLESLTKASGV